MQANVKLNPQKLPHVLWQAFLFASVISHLLLFWEVLRYALNFRCENYINLLHVLRFTYIVSLNIVYYFHCSTLAMTAITQERDGGAWREKDLKVIKVDPWRTYLQLTIWHRRQPKERDSISFFFSEHL